MEKTEPSFVPEWLKSSGSVTASANTNHQYTSSSLQSDDHAMLRPARNKSLLNINSHDSGRSPGSDRTTSSYFRRTSSSNGSAHLRSYGSFGRTNRDRDWDNDVTGYRDKEKASLGDHRHRNYSEPLGRNLVSRFEKDGLRRTQSSVSGKNGEPWSRKVSADLNNSSKSNYNNGGIRVARSSPINRVRKSAFERDFPSLGAEESRTDSESRRVPSPGLSMAIQSLSIGSSAVVGDVGWTSALAEAPVMVGGNGTSISSVSQVVLPSSASAASSMTTGLNMAETLVQGSPRLQATPELPTGTQRLEELAIKQSRQLIPMTPSMPKALVLNSLDKSKPKVAQQQHQPSSAHLVSPSPRGTLAKSDMMKTLSLGKLQVLKPARERNGTTYAAKDSFSPKNGSNVAHNPLGGVSSAVVPSPLMSPANNPNSPNVDRKPAAVLVPTILEKKTSSQIQSRNDFFNLVRKKSLANSSPPVADTVSTVSPSVLQQPRETEAAAPLTRYDGDSLSANQSTVDQLGENMNSLIGNTNACDRPHKSCDNGKNRSVPDVILCSEEEEAAFLRSLGWDENAGEDEGLTEEEIMEFYREASKYIKPDSSSKTSQ